LRHNSREQQLETQDAPCEPAVITRRLIDQLLSGNARYGSILEAFYLFGYSADEIAKLYNTSGVAIRVRLARARAAIRPLVASKSSCPRA
jgi:DNA-directed RNA polymerase specialized sigma24 family protein